MQFVVFLLPVKHVHQIVGRSHLVSLYECRERCFWTSSNRWHWGRSEFFNVTSHNRLLSIIAGCCSRSSSSNFSNLHYNWAIHLAEGGEQKAKSHLSHEIMDETKRFVCKTCVAGMRRKLKNLERLISFSGNAAPMPRRSSPATDRRVKMLGTFFWEGKIYSTE